MKVQYCKACGYPISVDPIYFDDDTYHKECLDTYRKECLDAYRKERLTDELKKNVRDDDAWEEILDSDEWATKTTYRIQDLHAIFPGQQENEIAKKIAGKNGHLIAIRYKNHSSKDNQFTYIAFVSDYDEIAHYRSKMNAEVLYATNMGNTMLKRVAADAQSGKIPDPKAIDGNYSEYITQKSAENNAIERKISAYIPQNSDESKKIDRSLPATRSTKPAGKLLVTIGAAVAVLLLASVIPALNSLSQEAFLLLLWLVLCWAVGIYSHIKVGSFIRGFVVSLILSPLIGFIIVTDRAEDGIRYDEKD